MPEVLVAVAAALVGAVVLMTRKAELTRWGTTALWLGEFIVVVVSFFVLGWMGLVLALTVLVVAVVASSVRLAMQLESALLAATILGKLDMTKDELKVFHRSLHRSERSFAHISRVQSAELIRVLSECARTASEIRTMAPWIVKLWIIGGLRTPDTRSDFARRFDRCMRLWRMEADEAQRMADNLLTGAKQSAASMDDMLDGLIAMKDSTLS